MSAQEKSPVERVAPGFYRDGSEIYKVPEGATAFLVLRQETDEGHYYRDVSDPLPVSGFEDLRPIDKATEREIKSHFRGRRW